MVSEVSYYILLALAQRQLHGYGIIQRAAELSDGRVRPAAGTLYGALDRMCREGLLEASEPEIVAGRARRYYQLTNQGRTSLVAEAQRLIRSATVARDILGSAVSPA